MKLFSSLTPLRCLFLLCLLAATTNVMASGHTPSKYSTTWTTSNQIYLYNKATGLYLSTDGRWGTEGMLKATGMPVYLSKDNSAASDCSSVAMYSKSDKSKTWGLLTSAESYDPVKNGLFCDASDNYPAQTFTFKYNSDDNTYSIYRDTDMDFDNIAIKFESPSGVTYYLAPSTTNVTTLLWSTAPYFWAFDTNHEYVYAVDGSSKSVRGTKYYLYHENDGTLKVSSTKSYASQCIIDDDGCLRVGQSELYLNYNTDGTFPLSSTATSAATATSYDTHSSNVYLCQQGGTDARQNIVTEYIVKDGNAIPDNARWYIVTKQDMIDDFESATASTAQPKEATFYIANPDFSRTVDVANAWTISEDNNSYSGPYTRLGDSLYNPAGPISSTNTGATSTVLEDSETGTLVTSKTYGANGSGYTVTSDDVQYIGIAAGEKTYYHAVYAGYYNCRMLSNGGSNAARSISQSITGLKAGYYKVSCDGYTYNPSGATGVAKLYAKTTDDAGKSNASVSLVEDDTYKSMTQAGIDFYNNGQTSKYRTSVIVYVPSGATLELGVSISGGVFSGNAKNGAANTFAEIDAFKLEYTGNPTYDIILDETKDNYTIGTSGLNYIDAQVYNETTGNARTLYLQRAMKAGQWNSIVLPVSITAGALKSAFGEDVELVKFDNCTGNTITFKDVLESSTADSKVAIEAGKCYLIKPSDLNGKTEGSYSTEYAKISDTSISVTASTANPVFVFNQVTLTDNISTPTASDVFTPTYDTDITAGLKFMGTYFSTTGAIGYGSYAINAADGNWYRYTGSTKLNVGGFRTWIGCTGDKKSDSNPAKLTMVINGEQMEPTEIAGITTEEPVMQNSNIYSINGQLMGNAQNVNKLPKGLYILNGKKFIVK